MALTNLTRLPSVLSVADRCIPLLTNLTMDDVVFKDILQTTPVASLANTVTVTDIVNSTKLLAELLNAGKVCCLAL